MEGNRIIVISTNFLFAEAIVRILQVEGMNLVARTDSLEEAQPLLNKYRPDIIIVDRDQNSLSDDETISLLTNSSKDCRVICLTLASNQMIIYHRQSVENATSADLIEVLRGPPYSQVLQEKGASH